MKWNDIRDWNLKWTRTMSLQKASDYIDGATIELEKAFGRGLKYMILVKNKDNIDFFISEKDYSEFNDYYESMINSKFFRLLKDYISNVEIILDKMDNLTKDVSNLSDKELVNLLKKLINLRIRTYPLLWYVVIFEERLENLYQKKVKHYNIDPNIFYEITRPTFIDREIEDLKKVKTEEDLKRHTAKYSYIPMYDLDYEPYSIEFFREKLKSINSLEHKDFVKNKKDVEKALSIIDKEDRLFFEFFSYIVWCKEERSSYRSRDSSYLRRIFDEISKRTKLPISNLVNISYEELFSLILTKKYPDKRLYGFFAHGHNKDYLYKEDVENLYAKNNLGNVVKGIPANPGLVKGRAVIVLSSKDIHKVKEGDILISPVTRPDFVMSMKKVKAVVTDEGGLISHAAIVSRELGKPCVVGTKNATKVFRDGDLVEVDANKGVVRKLD